MKNKENLNKLIEARSAVMNAKSVKQYQQALARLGGLAGRGSLLRQAAARMGGLASGVARRKLKTEQAKDGN